MSDGIISYKASHDVTLIVDPQYITVDKSDWSRLKREVDTCKVHTDWWMNIAFASISTSASAFITWLSLRGIAGNETICVVLLCVVIACIILGIICICAHKSFVAQHESDISDVKQVISDIEKLCALI